MNNVNVPYYEQGRYACRLDEVSNMASSRQKSPWLSNSSNRKNRSFANGNVKKMILVGSQFHEKKQLLMAKWDRSWHLC